MTQPKLISGDHNQMAAPLRNYIERLEELIEDRKERQKYISEAFAEAKADGFDVKAIREILKKRALDTAEREELEENVTNYQYMINLKI